MSNEIMNSEVISSEYGVFIETKTAEKKKVVRDYTATDSQIEYLSKYGTKSDAIRQMNKDGMTNSQIADLLNIRYQHVRNVLNQIVKKK